MNARLDDLTYVEVILKITERCNINCDYCYVFNRGNYVKAESPPLLSLETAGQLCNMLSDGCRRLGVRKLRIDLHGGEPLLYKKDRFDELCNMFRNLAVHGLTVDLVLQTNGMLIDKDWIDLFHRHDIGIGISLDGPKHSNDRHRLDHKGRSSYDGSLRGLRMLQAAHSCGLLSRPPSVLCVASTENDGRETYRHFVDDLQLNAFDFLLPDSHHDDLDLDEPGIRKFFLSAFDEWIRDDNPRIYVRIFQSLLTSLLGGQRNFIGLGGEVEGAYAFTVGTDGHARIDDTLRSTGHIMFERIGHVSELTLEQLLSSPQVGMLTEASKSLPTTCEACVWKGLCAGGRVVNRFSQLEAFRQKTVFCETMRALLSRGANRLISTGVPPTVLDRALAA